MHKPEMQVLRSYFRYGGPPSPLYMVSSMPHRQANRLRTGGGCMKLRTKLIRKHVKGCRAMDAVADKTWNTPWYFPNGHRGVPGTVRRDSIGRATKGTGEQWLVLNCNSTKCSGQMIVALDDVLGALPNGEGIRGAYRTHDPKPRPAPRP